MSSCYHRTAACCRFLADDVALLEELQRQALAASMTSIEQVNLAVAAQAMR
jgi:hypothetical protein